MRTLALLVLGILTAACGFQLRGQATLPFETLYVAIPEISPLAIELKRNIVAGTRTLDLHDGGAKVGEHLRAEGSREDAREIENANV